MRSVFTMCTLALSMCITHGCAHAPTPETAQLRHEVVVLGMIHSGHSTSERYGVEQLKDIIRRIQPDVVLTEIPPDRLQAAQDEFASTGIISEPRVRVFPEYVDVLFPLTREMDFEIVPCAAWTRTMADDRRALLTQWRTTRAEESKRVNDAMAQIDEQIRSLGDEDDPLLIHTDQYDEYVRAGMRPYQELFGDDLGPGGWDTINAAHYALIEAAIDERCAVATEPQRFLITFGSWHKYWFKDQLRKRNDITILGARSFIR